MGLRAPWGAEQELWVMTLTLPDRRLLHLAPILSPCFHRIGPPIGLTVGRALSLWFSLVLDSVHFAPPFQESQNSWRNIAWMSYSWVTWVTLGTCRNKIELLKLHFEERVNKEWFLWTYIQKAVAGYPIGSVASIHASAAKQIWKWDMACRAGIDDEHWQCSAAVGGHLLGLKLFRP